MKAIRDTQGLSGRCPPPEEVVTFAVDGETAVGSVEVLQHTAHCARCRAVMKDTRDTLARLRRSTDALPAADLVPRILNRIPEGAWKEPARQSTSRLIRFPSVLLLPARIAAAALLLLGGALLVLHLADRAAEESVSRQSQDGAVGKGVDWLLAKQTSSGGWNVEELGGQLEYAPAINGLAVLALTRGAQDVSALRPPLGRAAAFLLRQQADNGRFGKEFDGTMYNQGIATLALLETYCVTQDEALRAPVAKALAFVRSRQSHDGGWGYGAGPNDRPNTSITAWQVQSLLLADRLGWRENGIPLRRALRWMSGTVNGKGFFGYERTQHFPEGPNTVTMMGAYCLLAAQNLNIPVDPAFKARVVRGVGRLAGDTPDDYYGAYFHSSALAEAGPDAFRDSLAATRSSLAARQQSAGDEKGNWRADDRWSSAGGRLYSTSMALMALASPERHPPDP